MATVAKRSRQKVSTRGSKPGERRGGRKAGVPNKVTASVKQALVEAFDELGGVPSLVAWGRAEPDKFYPLWSRMLPLDVAHSADESFTALIAKAFGQ